MTTGQPLTLATGLDKVRNDYCLLLWDCEKQSAAAAANNYTPIASRMGSPALAQQRPLQQYGSSEAITSLAWFSKHRGLLAAGMGFKWLRLYDTRQENANPSIVLGTKAVYGLAVDTFHDYRFASFTEEGVVKVFDMRAPNDALLTLNQDARSGLARIAFHPTRPGYLASLSKDEEVVRLWNIQDGPAITTSNATERPSFLAQAPVDAPSILKDTASILTSTNASTMGYESPSIATTSATVNTVEAPFLWKARVSKCQ
jgi:WD40 repeat protein